MLKIFFLNPLYEQLFEIIITFEKNKFGKD